MEIDVIKLKALQLAIAAIREPVADAQIVERAEAFEKYLRAGVKAE